MKNILRNLVRQCLINRNQCEILITTCKMGYFKFLYCNINNNVNNDNTQTKQTAIIYQQCLHANTRKRKSTNFSWSCHNPNFASFVKTQPPQTVCKVLYTLENFAPCLPDPVCPASGCGQIFSVAIERQRPALTCLSAQQFVRCVDSGVI